jgi:hypothetical protein
MTITKFGRRAVQSAGFQQDLRKIVNADGGTDAALVYTAIVLCADANGRVAIDDVDDEAIAEFCQQYAGFLTMILHDAVSVN